MQAEGRTTTSLPVMRFAVICQWCPKRGLVSLVKRLSFEPRRGQKGVIGLSDNQMAGFNAQRL
jgi:hypothetical protein